MACSNQSEELKEICMTFYPANFIQHATPYKNIVIRLENIDHVARIPNLKPVTKVNIFSNLGTHFIAVLHLSHEVHESAITSHA